MKCLKFIAFLLFSVVTFAAPDLKEGQWLRDAEIEDVLQSYLHPLFKQAGLNPRHLNLYIVNSSEVNAAATLGHVILVNTGLILNAENASEVVGVLAHETAHLEGGHVLRLIQRMDDLTLPMIISAIAGAAAAAAAQNADGATAIIFGSQHLAQRHLLSFTRVHEGAADAGGVRYLKALNWPVSGLASFLDRMSSHELLGAEPVDPYAVTHPLSNDRVDFYRHAAQQQESNPKLPAGFEERFLRIRTKIAAFTDPIGQVLMRHKGDSDVDRYARAIGHFRRSDFAAAHQELDQLIATHPKDPFYLELKADILFDQGKIKESIPVFQKVLQMRPDLTLVRVAYARALIESRNPAVLTEAEEELLRAKTEDTDNPFIWNQLSVVYGKQGKMGLASLAMAEQFFLSGDYKQARQKARLALQDLKGDAKHLRRAEHLIEQIKTMLKE